MASFVEACGLLSSALVACCCRCKAVLSFPDAAALPDIPVIAQGFTPSAETLELRRVHELMRQHHAERFLVPYENGGQESQSYLSGLSQRYDTASERLWARLPLTWGHVAELAEVAWYLAPKEERVVSIAPGLNGFDYYTGRLARNARDGFGRHRFQSDSTVAANAALIEAVLTLSGGQRYDCNFEGRMDGWWLDCPDWVHAMEAANA